MKCPCCGSEDIKESSGVVLDPFMGAGTVAVCALKLKRKFVGIELQKKYIEISEERIKGLV